LVADRSDFKVELDRLRAEIASLLNLPALSREFVSWLGKLLDLVKGHFGPDSDELRQLREISPELSVEFYDSIGARIGSLGLDGKLTNQLLMRLNRDIPELVFRKRLYDYDDLIASMTVGPRPAG
jgi:hypothetical protein